MLGLFLIPVFRSIPMGIWLLKEFIKGIPIEMEEAALVDGATIIRILVRVVLPLTAPGLAAIGLMTVALGIYYASLETTGWGYATINYDVLAAITVFYVLPSILLYFIMQKYLVREIMIEALKMWKFGDFKTWL